MGQQVDRNFAMPEAAAHDLEGNEIVRAPAVMAVLSRGELDEARSALRGAIAVLGDVANLAHALAGLDRSASEHDLQLRQHISAARA